ncbi:ABC transporter substrate-binding protein [Gluconacetobacter tumulisoli]|uniref:ABC transporter substrate-binding protein n=2 Tax=Gluconacetobacter tumulisoli TaxID=1286189 RepID=A0A7W4K6Y2_9PROT|nr:ABC transporter substrate-binding protein [Gluconacetobacter tumulisoli]
MPGRGQARTVVDMAGHSVSIPERPGRIADLWFAHNTLTIMLGAVDRIAVTDDLPSARPWMYRVAPALARAVPMAGPVPNAETLLGAGVDVAFVSAGSPAELPLRRIGMPVVDAGFTDAASMIRAVDLTADVLGDARSHDMARLYEATLTEAIRRVRTATAPVAITDRPRILHVKSLAPLTVDGADTIIDDWITIAGGRNAADGIVGVMRPVSMEQVAAWDPDVLILGPDAGTFDDVPQGSAWSALRAVRTGRVYRNPAGVFPWDRYGCEFLLQILWTAQKLYPDRFRDIDMMSETTRFYHMFFGYDLTPAEARRILSALPPEGGQ